jgi:hypothetical protein
MKNKLFLVFVLSLIAVLSFNLNSLDDSKKDQGKAKSGYVIKGTEKILFIGRGDSEGKPTEDDNITLARMKKMGLKNINFVTDKQSLPEDANGQTMVFISESVDSKRVVDKFIDAKIPVMCLEAFILDDMQMTTIDAESYGKIPDKIKSIKIVKPEHVLAAGFKDEVEVYKTEGTIGFGIPSKEAVIVATAPNNDKQATIFYYDKGAKNIEGKPVPAKRVYFYLFWGFEKDHTDKGWKLFEAAVKFTLE